MLSQPIVDLLAALETDGVAVFRKVAGAANFAAAQDDLKNPPAAYVIPLSDSARPNALDCGGIEQAVVERFGVILAVENKRDTRGDAANAQLETKRRKVLDALLGFVPGDGYEPCQYGGGALLKLDEFVLWWRLEFVTGYLERKV